MQRQKRSVNDARLKEKAGGRYKCNFKSARLTLAAARFD